MNNHNKMRIAIDRMVEESIRRILPSVMNEVLVATIARASSSIVTEEKPLRRKVKKRKNIREQRPKTPSNKRGQKTTGLHDILDESAGSEFYHQGHEESDEIYHDEPDVVDNRRITDRIKTLPPEIQSLAEGLELDDDGGEMWADGERDSGNSTTHVMGDIRDIGNAARSVGMDFSRMKSVIGVTSPVRKISQSDVAANASFEQLRLKRMRERLNDGKPVE